MDKETKYCLLNLYDIALYMYVQDASPEPLYISPFQKVASNSTRFHGLIDKTFSYFIYHATSVPTRLNTKHYKISSLYNNDFHNSPNRTSVFWYVG